MVDSREIRRALETLNQHGDRFAPGVLATLNTVLEEQAQTLAGATPPSLAQTLGPVSERRPVTALFAEVSMDGRGIAGDSAPEELRALWRRLDGLIASHGGTVDKHMGDIVLAVFGVPAAAENDAERAVRCALAARQLVAAARTTNESLAGLRFRAGVNSGLVSVGPVGSEGLATVMGDVVNIASRLREAADAETVVLGESTYRLVEPFYEVEPLGQQPIKGRHTPVTTFRVLAARPRLFFSSGRGIEGITPPMVGRETELVQLKTAVGDAARKGRGQFILITGEAGVGKSRLAAELNAWLRDEGPPTTVFQGRSDQRFQGASFSLLRDLLTSYFDILDSDAPDVTEARLLEALRSLRRSRTWPAFFRERVRAVAGLIGLELGRGGAGTGHSARPSLDRAQHDILEFFELMANSAGAAVVFLEDIHWADNDSLGFIELLGELTARTSLVVVAMARPQLFERRPRWLAGTPRPRVLTLSPLSPENSHDLARAILRRLPEPPAGLIDLLVRAAGGNPFYMEELVKVLISDGAIVAAGDAWRLGDAELDRLRLPDSLAGILQARLDRLSGVERMVLQQAAVMGDEFWDSSVQQLNQAAREPIAAEEVSHALRALVEADMIYRLPLSTFAGAQAYQFRHAALREAAYQTVLLRDRPFYHVAAAEWLEQQSGDRLADYAAPIAEHYELAGDRQRAAELYELAGRRALSLQRPGRAADYYSRALALLEWFPHQIDRRLELLRALGSAQLAKGRATEAVAAFAAMERAAGDAGDLLEQAAASLALAVIYDHTDRLAEGLAAAQRAADVAALTGADEEWLRAERDRIAALLAARA